MLPPRATRLPEPLLYAVVRGSARIIADGDRHLIQSGTALWAPAGATVEVRASSEAIVIPVPAASTGPVRPAIVDVDPAHLPGLLHEFSRALGHLDAAHEDAAPSEPGVRVRTATRSRAGHGLSAPPAPASPELQDLAEMLADDPHLDLASAVEAAVTGWSVRTAQRRFAAETGLTLSAWVRRARAWTAAELLAEGRDIEWVAHRVGYHSSAAFVRGFAEVVGTTPGRWRRSPDAEEPAAELVVSSAWRRRTHRTWARVNGGHVAVWVAVGSAAIAVGGRELRLRAGEAVVLPAGVRNDIGIEPGSLLLPVGFRSGRTGAIGAPLAPAQVGGIDSWHMVSAMLAAYTGTGGGGADPSRGFDAVLRGSTRADVGDDDTGLAALASLIALEPHLTIEEAGRRLGRGERDLRRIVRERSGETPAAWSRMVRMTRARNRLGLGETATEVSRELGYAHLPAFSRAFRAVHGTAPASVGCRAPSALLPARSAQRVLAPHER